MSQVYTYNAFGKVRTATLPGDGSIPEYTYTNTYDMAGRIASKTDSLSRQTLYTYDSFGRELTETERKSNGAQSISVTKKYDKTGNLRSVTDPMGTVTSYTYNMSASSTP